MRTYVLALLCGAVLGFFLATPAVADVVGQYLRRGGDYVGGTLRWTRSDVPAIATPGGIQVGGALDAGSVIVNGTGSRVVLDTNACISLDGTRGAGASAVAFGICYDGTEVLIRQSSDNAIYITSDSVVHIANMQISNAGSINMLGSSAIKNTTAGLPVLINDAEGLRFTPTVLATCTSAIQGTLNADIYTGDAGVRTKLCLCTNAGIDGGGTAAWQNVATGAIGDATTCGANP